VHAPTPVNRPRNREMVKRHRTVGSGNVLRVNSCAKGHATTKKKTCRGDS